jgi:hypothetical protein
MALNAGFAFGPATAGLLAKHSFLWLFVGDAATSLLYGLVAWFALPAGVHGMRAESSLRETWKVLRTDHRFRQVLCASLAVGLVFVQVFSTMSLEITRHGFSASVYGLMISLNGALVVLCELPLTTLTRRYPARRMMALGYLLIGVGFASNALPRTLPLLALTVVLFTPMYQRGLYMGTYGLTWSLAFIAGPSLGMLLFSVSPLTLWGACGLLGLLAAGIILARQPVPQQPANKPTGEREAGLHPLRLRVQAHAPSVQTPRPHRASRGPVA